MKHGLQTTTIEILESLWAMMRDGGKQTQNNLVCLIDISAPVSPSNAATFAYKTLQGFDARMLTLYM